MYESAFFFLVNLSWQVALIACLTGVGLKLGRIQSPQIRRIAWLAVALSPLPLSVMGAMPSNLSVYRAEAPDNHRAALQNHPEVSAFTSIPDHSLPAESNASPIVQTPPPFSLRSHAFSLMLGLWMLGSTMGLVRIAGGYWRLRSFIARADAIHSGPLHRAFRDTRQAVGLMRNVRLFVSPETKTPFALAGFPAMVVFPASLIRSNLQLRMICIHEQVHLKQYDDWYNLCCRLFSALLFFHPLYHLAIRELENANEELCDGWAVALTGERQTYAACLLEFAKHNADPLPIGFSESGKALARRLEAICNPDILIRRVGTRTLISIGAGVASLILIISLVRLIDNSARNEPIPDALQTSQTEFIAEVARGLENPSASVRSRLVEILADIGAPAVPMLIRTLSDESASVRQSAAAALGKIGPQAAPAMPALINALHSSDGVRDEIIETLGKIGPDAKSATPHLTALLASPSSSVRSKAAGALGNIQPSSPAAIGALIQLLQDRSKSVRSQAARAIVQTGAPAVPALANALQNPDTPDRHFIVALLGKIGAPAVPVLIQTLQNPSDRLRWEAADALGDMKTTDPRAVAALIDALNDPHGKVRWEAVDALGDARASGQNVTAALIHTLNNDKSESVRHRTIQALGETSAPDRETVAALIRALDDKSEKIRLQATETLKAMGKQ